ncbi:FKBP-type peptidyl-prolyl cis-trans isomerase [Mucilaginibacter glaciei]|uniref:Peptidyl-prolyl cis-trans isomerase n=1 Tax=Mucilaginibacter glaciei TaxID=2772109 RepID=A0A926S1G9_9SPHI|nr:FKBP-type peptidyl-prolyl cis-trans isomerase [Mucilaginibacter glaciei]MBD1393068.1 FKBP-type peptidyl-prolyl cis-trans isomerase [Mucilaginibacter glaciei]
MKQRIFTLLLLAVTGFTACKKSQEADPDIKQYDDQQIQGYIAANGLTGFVKDTVAADSSGMYYKIINKGTGVPLEYSDRVSLVFTLKTLDGKYTSSDTITNHIYRYLGQLAPSATVAAASSANLPIGLQQAIKNILKYRDGSMRLLIPSRLAYGTKGIQNGSITNVNTNIAGNQSLEYYVHVINDQQVYDDLVIRNYITANNLTGYSKTASGIYYKNVVAGDNVAIIGSNSTYSANYTLKLLNNVQLEVGTSANTSFTNGVSATEPVAGVKEILLGKSVGSAVSMIIPSRLAYGISGSSTTIPSNAPLYFDFQIVTVTN